MYQHADTTCLHIVLQVYSGQGDHKKAVQYFKLAAAEEPNEKVNMADQLSTRRADLLSVLCLLCVCVCARVHVCVHVCVCGWFLMQYIQKMLQRAQQRIAEESRQEKAMYRRMMQGLGRDEGEEEGEGEGASSTGTRLVRALHWDIQISRS